jgi:hypothetical protein
MGVRTRGLDIKASAKRGADDKASRADAKAVVERWNEQLAAGRDMLRSPTIRAALLAGSPWLDVLPRLRNQPRHRSPHHRPAPARIRRHAGARAAVLMVSRVGANAEADRVVRAAASEAGTKGLKVRAASAY